MDSFKNFPNDPNFLLPNNINLNNQSGELNSSNLRTSIIVVDSRNRDVSKYPDANNYTYLLNESYRRVYEMEMLYAFIPRSQNLINNSNNILYLNLDNTKINLVIPAGNYSQTDDSKIDIPSKATPITPFISKNLDYIINLVLNKYTKGSKINCLYDHNTDKYYFVYNNYVSGATAIKNANIKEFNLDFKGKKEKISNFEDGTEYILEEKQMYKENSIGSILGFLPIPKNNNGSVYSNQNSFNVHFTFDSSLKRMTFISPTEELFDQLYFTITNSNPLLSRFSFSNTSDFSSSVDTLNFNIDSPGYGPDNYKFENVYNGTNNKDIWKVFEVNRSTRKIMIETSSYSGGLGNSSSTNVYIRFSYLTGDNKANLTGENYALLQVEQLDRLESTSTIIQNSYELVPFTQNHQIFEHSKAYGNIKVFNPVLSNLDKLRISFKNFDGSLYDFNGKEHSLIFAVTYNNKNIL